MTLKKMTTCPSYIVYKGGEERGTIKAQLIMQHALRENKSDDKRRRQLLQFEDATTRFAKIQNTTDNLLADNPKLTTADINKILYRQFGMKIHKGTVSWNGETIQIKDSVIKKLKQNYLASKGITPNLYQTPTNKNPLPSQRDNRGRKDSPLFGRGVRGEAPLANAGGLSGANREYEINGGMDVSGIDDGQPQRNKWKR